VDLRKRFEGKIIPANYTLPSFGSSIDRLMENRQPLTPELLLVVTRVRNFDLVSPGLVMFSLKFAFADENWSYFGHAEPD
jgi:hypothetical protein